MRFYVESHDGWKADSTSIDGQHRIVDANGWTLATVHYDYRYTSNGTNDRRSRMLAAAPEMLAALEQMLDDMRNPGDLCVCQGVKDMALAAYEKATGEKFQPRGRP